MAIKPTVWWPTDTVSIKAGWGADPVWYQTNVGQKGHNGEDLGDMPIGTPVYAVDDGIILFEGNGANDSWMGAAAGNCVRIRHGWGITGYAHLNTTIVNINQRVSKGQQIGTVGMTGLAFGAHLHHEYFPLVPFFGNGYAGRVNRTSLVNSVARGTNESIAEDNGGLPMFDVYWTGPAVNNTGVSGRLVTNYGSFWIPSMQIYTLLLRRKNAALKPGASDNMLDAEHDIINNYLRTCFQSAQTGVQLDAAKLKVALTDALKAAGTNLTVDVTTEIPVEKLAKAFEDATPRIVASMIKQAGQKLVA